MYMFFYNKSWFIWESTFLWRLVIIFVSISSIGCAGHSVGGEGSYFGQNAFGFPLELSSYTSLGPVGFELYLLGERSHFFWCIFDFLWFVKSVCLVDSISSTYLLKNIGKGSRAVEFHGCALLFLLDSTTGGEIIYLID